MCRATTTNLIQVNKKERPTPYIKRYIFTHTHTHTTHHQLRKGCRCSLHLDNQCCHLRQLFPEVCVYVFLINKKKKERNVANGSAHRMPLSTHNSTQKHQQGCAKLNTQKKEERRERERGGESNSKT